MELLITSRCDALPYLAFIQRFSPSSCKQERSAGSHGELNRESGCDQRWQMAGKKIGGASLLLQAHWRGLEQSDVLSLRAFVALGHSELDFLTFSQGFETCALDGGEVNENVRSLGLLDKAKTLGLIEPFYLAGANVRHVLSPIYNKMKLSLVGQHLPRNQGLKHH
jgi:hypothetical protein